MPLGPVSNVGGGILGHQAPPPAHCSGLEPNSKVGFFVLHGGSTENNLLLLLGLLDFGTFIKRAERAMSEWRS